MIDKCTHLVDIKPVAPKLNVYTKTHKQNEPIRLVVDNTYASSYKIAKYLNKRLNNLIRLPTTYSTKNSHEIALELNNIQILKLVSTIE
jgi:hypothetical protein